MNLFNSRRAMFNFYFTNNSAGKNKKNSNKSAKKKIEQNRNLADG